MFCGNCWSRMEHEGNIVAISESYLVNNDKVMTAKVIRCPYCDNTVLISEGEGDPADIPDYDKAEAFLPAEVNRPLKKEKEQEMKEDAKWTSLDF